MKELGFVTGSQKTMLDHSAKIPPTPAPTHTSTEFIQSGMKAIFKQNWCGCQAGDQFTCLVEDVGDRGERRHLGCTHSDTEGNWRSAPVRDRELGLGRCCMQSNKL